MLEIKNLSVYYGPHRAVEDLSLEVKDREIVALVGANGAGKSTLLKTVSGLMRPRAGEILFDGRRVDGLAANAVLRAGIVHVPEGRRVFSDLTVEENLYIGAFSRRDSGIKQDVETIYSYFPMLKERRNQFAGSLSGGEQQMLAIGRGLMGRPKLMMLDEPMLGLAPVMVDKVIEIIQSVNGMGISVLLAEQNINAALSVAHRGYVVETGRITMEGTSQGLADHPKVRQAYLGA